MNNQSSSKNEVNESIEEQILSSCTPSASILPYSSPVLGFLAVLVPATRKKLLQKMKSNLYRLFVMR